MSSLIVFYASVFVVYTLFAFTFGLFFGWLLAENKRLKLDNLRQELINGYYDEIPELEE